MNVRYRPLGEIRAVRFHRLCPLTAQSGSSCCERTAMNLGFSHSPFAWLYCAMYRLQRATGFFASPQLPRTAFSPRGPASLVRAAFATKYTRDPSELAASTVPTTSADWGFPLSLGGATERSFSLHSWPSARWAGGAGSSHT